MKIIIEKKAIVGVVKTANGEYNLLDLDTRLMRIGNFLNSVQFHALDSEGFETYIYVYGDYVMVPMMLPVYQYVKIVLADEEAKDLDQSVLFSDEVTIK